VQSCPSKLRRHRPPQRHRRHRKSHGNFPSIQNHLRYGTRLLDCHVTINSCSTFVISLQLKARPNNLPQTTISGTESDSDSVISPELSPLALHSLSHQHGVAHTAQIHGSLTGAVKPLGSIKEHSRDIEEGDQEDDSDEEEDEDDGDGDGGHGLTQQEEALWKSQAARGETAIKSGYLLKKGERRKVSTHITSPSHIISNLH